MRNGFCKTRSHVGVLTPRFGFPSGLDIVSGSGLAAPSTPTGSVYLPIILQNASP
jgi:hypothetical protein